MDHLYVVRSVDAKLRIAGWRRHVENRGRAGYPCQANLVIRLRQLFFGTWLQSREIPTYVEQGGLSLRCPKEVDMAFLTGSYPYVALVRP